VPSSGKSLSGMGTPDLEGTPGTFSFYGEIRPPKAGDDGKMGGGRFIKVAVNDNHVKAKIIGPDNSFRRTLDVRNSKRSGHPEYDNPPCTIDYTVYLDPQEPVAKFVVQDAEFILKQGEWSDWIRLDFEAVPYLVKISATVRFYLQQVRPDFKLYATPLQINPEDPALPISTPEDWSKELYQALGCFFTQGLPEDSKAFSNGIFSGREFWDQAQLILRERQRALDYLLDRFDDGLLFFYFSSLDQGSHMLWRYMDRNHPAFEDDEKLADGIKTLYREMDGALGRVLNAIDEDTILIVMSDHGFCPFYWGVNLNSWLVEMGYLKLLHPAEQERYTWFMDVDWKQTKAYAIGLNGLNVNLRGREKNGIVSAAEYDQLLDELETDLLAMEDPLNRQHPISLVTRTHRDFHGPYAKNGPDIIVGYNRGYRTSWKSPLGSFPKELYVKNDDPWSGDHCMDYRVIPGILVTNQKITLDSPALYDLTVAVLDEYGIDPLPEMIGKDCLSSSGRTGPTVLAPSDEKNLESIGYAK
ncbi:MAG: alkaline phosphatase family protein, partial [bacterium]